MLWVATKLRIPLSRRDLEVEIRDPFGDPAHFAVAGQEAASEAEAAQWLIQMHKGLFWHRGHGVAIQGQQSQVFGLGKRGFGQWPYEVEAQIQDLKWWR